MFFVGGSGGMADALDSGSSGSFILWEFKSPLPHDTGTSGDKVLFGNFYNIAALMVRRSPVRQYYFCHF